MATRLDQLEIGAKAVVMRLDDTQLSAPAIRRLRAVGVNEGASVELLHQGVLLARDPLAVRVGRMTLALRVAQAAAIEVEVT